MENLLSMEKVNIDYRKVSPEALFNAKKNVIMQWENGLKTSQIKDNTGLCINVIRETIRKYKQGGMKALKPRKEGRPAGSCMSLDNEKSAEIRKAVIDKDPDQLKLPFALWTRKAVQELVSYKYGKTMPIRTIGDYLKRWNFTPQKPAKKARRQDSAAVRRWLDTEYPDIKRKAREENASIYWLDETAVQNCSNLVRGYAPAGQTPVLRVETRKMHINMVSAISNIGKVYFKIYKEAMNTDILQDFCERLTREQHGRKVILICDNLRVHHAYVFRDWLATKKKEIEVFYLPSYSPEYNPDEYLNNDLKHNIALQPQARDVCDIQRNTEKFMSDLSGNPNHVKSYFEHEKLKDYKD